ncbi:MAG TPA: RNA polymerase sigma factor [Microthrixaceae bacterium]|nr:RNA polymerase sigma factor [Microthrixaceae bacterium]
MPALPRHRRPRRAEPRAVDRNALDRQLGDLIDEHTDAVFRLAFGILHDRQLTEDVVQETMMKAWTSLERFRGDASERTWILRIAHNTAIDALRRRRDQATAPDQMPELTDPADPAAQAIGRDSLAAVGRVLASLDETSRSIVVLREVEGMSYQEIADALGVPVPTVKTRLLRARRALQAATPEEEAT